MKNIILYFWYKFFGAFFRIFPIKNNRIVFQNFFGKGYGDNPKYIAEELLKRNRDFELIWLVKGKYYSNIPIRIKQIKRGTLNELYYLSTAKIWIDNSRKHNGVTKRNKQFYIQTWHGDLALKKIEKDTINSLSKEYIKTAINDSKMIDYIISGSDFFSKIVKRAFWYEGKILECGSARTDIIINNKHSRNDRIALYAPTFRDNGDTSAYNLDYERIVEELNKATNRKWKLYIRFHPNDSYLQNGIKYNDHILDGSKISDINIIINKCSLLITDYSSSMFDAIYSNIPVILYIPDFENYIGSRGLYFNINDLPFEFSKDNEELYKKIHKSLNMDCKKMYNGFLKKISSYEKGTASKTVVDLILNLTEQ